MQPNNDQLPAYDNSENQTTSEGLAKPREYNIHAHQFVNLVTFSKEIKKLTQ